jgi:hypothetical protein
MGDIFLNFQDAYISEMGDMFVSSNGCNGLFKIHDGNNSFIGRFSNGLTDVQYLHKAVLKRKNTLFFVPTFGNVIDTYCIESGKFGNVCFAELNNKWTTTNVVINDDILFLPRNLEDYSFTFNMLKGEYKRIEWLEEELKKILKENPNAELYYATYYEGEVYAPIRSGNGILKIDLNSEKIFVLKPDIGNRNMYTIDINNGMAWITQEDKNSVLTVDIERNVWNELFIDKDIQDTFIPYNKIFFVADKAVIVSRKSGSLYVVDKDTFEYKKITLDGEIEDKNMASTIWFYGGRTEENKLILYPSRVDKCVELDVDNCEVHYMNTGNISYGNIINYNDNILYENRLIGIQDLINNINAI